MAAEAEAQPADDCCMICLEAVSDKRLVTILPCDHRLHRTCVVTWMELACCTGKQTCPLCRVGIIVLEDEDGKRLLPVRAFGESGQPTMNRVLTDAAHKSPLDYIIECIKEVRYWFLEVEAQLRIAEDAPAPSRNALYTEDIAAELSKLMHRMENYRFMHYQLTDDSRPAESPVGQHRCLHTERERMGRMAQGVRLRLTGPIGAGVVLVAAPVVRPPTTQLLAPPPPPRTFSRRVSGVQQLAAAARSFVSRGNSGGSRGRTTATSARATLSVRAARIRTRATRVGAIPPSLRL